MFRIVLHDCRIQKNLADLLKGHVVLDHLLMGMDRNAQGVRFRLLPEAGRNRVTVVDTGFIHIRKV